MPKIPIYNPNLIIETPRGPKAELYELFAEGRRAAAGVLGTVGRVEDAWGKIGRAIEFEKEKEQRAKQAVKALEIENGLRDDIDQLAESFYGRDDEENFENDANKSLQQLNEKYQTQIGGDRELGLAFTKTFGNQSNMLMRVIRDKKREVVTQKGLGEFKRNYDRSIQDYINASDDEERNLITKKLELTANALVTRRIMTPVQAETYINSFNKDVQEAKLIELYHNTPDLAILAIDKGQFPSLSAKELAQYKKASQDRFEAMKKKDEKETEEGLINDTILDLKKRFGTDYTLMSNKLSDTEYQKERGLTPILSKKVHDYLGGEKENYQAQRKASDDAIMKEANLLWGKGQLTRPWVELNAKNAYEPERVHQLYELLKSPIEGQDDPSAYFKILQQLQNPYISDVDKKKIEKEILSGPLSISTKKLLGKELYAPVDKSIFNDPWFKRADKEIKESLGWTEQMGFLALGKETGIQAQTSYRDISYKLIQDIKEENLKGEDIYKRSRQLMLPKQMEYYNLLMGGEKGKQPEKPKEKYEIGKIYPDAQGRKAKYLGNGKWEKIGW